MNISLFDADEVRERLPMKDCIDVLDAAMRAVSRGAVAAPPRMFVPHASGDSVLALMPGSSESLNVYGAKLISVHPGNAALDLPAIQGFVALFDSGTGTPRALVDGAALTAIRTAAASALATRELARGDALTHGIFGTGVQAVSHLDAIAHVREIRTTYVWSRDAQRAAEFAEAQSNRTGMTVEAAAMETVAGSDIVTTVTAAESPILFGRMLQPGSHVNLVGAHAPAAREADTDAVVAARVYVDSLPAALAEAGDILIPVGEGRISEEHIVGEIGQLLAGEISGRNDAAEITLYKSVGVVGQDLFAAAHVYETRVER